MKPDAPVDPYTLPHKAQRRWLAEAMTRAGCLDDADGAAVAALVADLHALVAALAAHARAEETFLHPVLRAHLPDRAVALAAEHDALAPRLDEVAALADRLAATAGDARAAAALALYRGLAAFTGAYLAHLADEEADLPRLAAEVPPGALEAAIGRFLASRSPADAVDDLARTIPAISPRERRGVLAGLAR